MLKGLVVRTQPHDSVQITEENKSINRYFNIFYEMFGSYVILLLKPKS